MSKLAVFKDLLVQRKDLLLCIFTTLIIQGIVTIITFNIVRKNKNKNEALQKNLRRVPVIFGILLVNILLLIAMTYDSISFNIKFVLFLLFSILQGVFLSGSLRYVKENILRAALYSTILIFVFFLVAGLVLVYFNIDLGGFGIVLFFLLLLLIISQIVSLFLKPSETGDRVITTFGLMLFSAYILYNTNNILLT